MNKLLQYLESKPTGNLQQISSTVLQDFGYPSSEYSPDFVKRLADNGHRVAYEHQSKGEKSKYWVICHGNRGNEIVYESDAKAISAFIPV
jgi:hypothetical protein